MKYYGNVGHYCLGHQCRFHITTSVSNEKYLVSTVGELVVDENKNEYEDIGHGRKYETMVFVTSGVCDCGCGMPLIEPQEIDSAGYNIRRKANLGHSEMCEKWDKR